MCYSSATLVLITDCMKVILLKDVAKIGRRFDVVTVPDGFALNKLIPKKLAEGATPENLKRLQNLSAKVAHDREMSETSFKETIVACKDVEISVHVEASGEGRMFQALKAQEVVDAIKKATGHELSGEHIIMKTPIKTTGVHEIPVASGNEHGVVTINVVANTK